jgi:hypothetical protein
LKSFFRVDRPRLLSKTLILTKEIEMKRILGIVALTAALWGPGMALAQTAPAQASMKTIGTPAAAAKPEIVPSLFVLNSRGATLRETRLP